MLKLTVLASSLSLATLVMSPCAVLADQHDKLEAAFKKADKDNDGTLTKEEAKAMPRVAKHFDAIDTDKDGTVSMDEIHTFMQAHHGRKHQ